MEDSDEKIPTKTVVEELQVAINWDIKYVDMEGRSDGKSIRNLLATLEPRRLILIHGTTRATEYLANVSRKFCNTVLTPKACEKVTLPLDTRVYDVTFEHSLFQKMGVHNFSG